MAVGIRILIFFLFLIFKCFAICYYPDGSAAPQDTPCNDETAESACCGQGYACLSNGVCQATGDEIQKPGASKYVRGSCTDTGWRSSSCPSFCINPQYNNVAGGQGMGMCEDTSRTLFYCIDERSVDCTSEENVLLFVGELACGIAAQLAWNSLRTLVHWLTKSHPRHAHYFDNYRNCSFYFDSRWKFKHHATHYHHSAVRFTHNIAKHERCTHRYQHPRKYRSAQPTKSRHNSRCCRWCFCSRPCGWRCRVLGVPPGTKETKAGKRYRLWWEWTRQQPVLG